MAWLVFGGLWLSLSALMAFAWSFFVRPLPPPSHLEALRALERITSPQSTERNRDLLRTGARTSRPSSA